MKTHCPQKIPSETKIKEQKELLREVCAFRGALIDIYDIHLLTSG